VTERFGDALELISDDSLDAAVLARPDEQHGPQANAAKI
jgi:predicted dehydrogenase